MNKRLNSLFILLMGLAVSLPAAISTSIRLDSVGYLPTHAKVASILGSVSGSFTVNRVADNSVAYTGTLGSPALNADTGETLTPADFSTLTTAGSYYLAVPSLGQSPNFQISPSVYNSAFWAEIMGFYVRRCGMAVSYTWNGQVYGHAACHLNDGYDDYVGGGHVQTVGEKGWHDAGDFGKYTVNTAFSLGQLLQAWDWHKAVLSQWTFPIPEDGGAIPDYLAECKYALDWLFTMQAPNGAAYHKLTALAFEGFIMPEADTSTRYFVPYSSAATADFCAVMSMASRLYAPYDASYASACLAAAVKAWSWLKANPAELVAVDPTSTGSYAEPAGSGDDPDHRAWAAAEYWDATGDAGALADFESRMAADPDLVSLYWDWGEHAYGKRGPKNIGIFDYLLSARSGRSTGTVSTLTSALLARANAIVATATAHGYGRPLGSVYHWGSNGTTARQAVLLDCANQISPNNAYVETELDAAHYLYGRNTYDRSFVTGVGYNPPMNPHDRLSASDGITNPVPGHLVGGPGGHNLTATDWTDTQADYYTNEIAINWDAGLVGCLASFVTVPPAPTATPTSTPAPCYSGTALFRVNAGGPTVTSSGNTWSADQTYASGGWGYSGGSTSTYAVTVAGTADPNLYKTEHYGMSSYQFTVPNGNYQVQLCFAESYFTAAGARVESVTLQGQPAINNLDIYATVGANTALVMNEGATVTNGLLSIGFSSSADQPEIRAIAIFPSVACTPTPSSTPTPAWTATPSPSVTPSFSASPSFSPSPSVSPTPSLSPTPCGTVVVARINAGGSAYTDSAGNLWSADSDFTGGAAASVTTSVAGTADPALYQSQRYGNPLAYAIPVPAVGTYQVRFLWAETYWTSPGSRVFSVYLEGAPAISNLDLDAIAGANTAYQLTRTVSVSDGVLNISTTASADNAQFNAIEVLWLAPGCASPSPSPTASPAWTRSASPSATLSATPSATPSASPTPTVTPTATPSASPTSTASPTPTVTASVSPSAIATASPTPAPSATPTMSATVSSSPSVTQTPSPRASVTATPTLTADGSSSPSPSPPASASPTLSPTATSGSLTPTRSPAVSPSASPTSIVTATLAPATPTPSLTPRPASATATATGTPSPVPTTTPSPSLSPNPTLSATASPLPVPSATATPLPTLTDSHTATPTPPSVSPSASSTSTASGTLTPTPTASRTALSTGTPAETPSASPSPSLPATPSVTAGAAASASPVILQLQAWPNPQAGPRWGLAVELSAAAAGLRLKVFTESLVLAARWEDAGAMPPGWNRIQFAAPGLPPGLYYVTAQVIDQGLGGAWACPAKLVRLP